MGKFVERIGRFLKQEKPEDQTELIAPTVADQLLALNRRILELDEHAEIGGRYTPEDGQLRQSLIEQKNELEKQA